MIDLHFSVRIFEEFGMSGWFLSFSSRGKARGGRSFDKVGPRWFGVEKKGGTRTALSFSFNQTHLMKVCVLKKVDEKITKSSFHVLEERERRKTFV